MTHFLKRVKAATLHAGLASAMAVALTGCAADQSPRESGFTTTVIMPRSATTAPPASPAAKVAGYTARKAAATEVRPPAAPPAKADEAACSGVDGCADVLRRMVEDPHRRWITRPASPAALASGVRLFAYRSLRHQLTCAELASGEAEIDAAARTFATPVPSLQLEQIERVRVLIQAVGTELRSESAARCAPGRKDGPIGANGRTSHS